MHPQGVNSPTFCAPPLDGSMSIAQMLEHHLEKSPRHKAYIYDDDQGGIVSIEFAQYIRTVYAACRNVLRDMAPHKAGAVVAIFADAGTDSFYFQCGFHQHTSPPQIPFHIVRFLPLFS
jgi:acyl-CoA synthetase (AMP-forming)/AMP-acid ligase II